MNVQDFSNIDSLRIKFKFIEKELNTLESKIQIKDGAWIFKLHRYTQEELVEDPTVKKVFAALGVISEDVKNWAENGAISDIVVHEYHNLQKSLFDRLDVLGKSIMERTPTIWHQVQSGVKILVQLIVSSLPVIPAILNGVVNLLLPSVKSQHLLEGTQRNRISPTSNGNIEEGQGGGASGSW